MARLAVKLHGEEIAQIALEAGQEYIAGRAQDAHIRLDTPSRGISRQHLKFYERDGVWVCESLSKFVHIQRGSDSMDVLELNEACVFTVSSYEFSFEPDDAQKPAVAENALAAPQEAAETGAQPLRNPPALTGEHSAPRANNDATIAGGTNLVPYFRISYPNTADDEVLKLEGQLWAAGRESDCEIHIDSPHVSRRHFELARTNNGYFVTDLGSSNGTRVNGIKIPPHEPTQLMSGDEISVQNIQMTFEIRDTQFANKLDRLPVPAFDPLAMGGGAMMGWENLGSGQEATVYQGRRSHSEDEGQLKGLAGLKKSLRKQNKVRLALYVLIPVVAIMALLPGKKPEDKAAGPGDKQSVTFDGLPKEKKMVVKDSFNLASSLYTSGKYALCLTELAKLHEIVPQYANSKELQSYCEQGMELKRREEDAERQRREREKIEAQVQSYVDACKASLKADATVDETRQCLSAAIELAPDHNLVVEMLHSAQMHEEEKKFMEAEKEKENARAARGVASYNRAMETYKKGQLHKSIGELEKFVSGNYPHTGELKEKAKRSIASIKAELKVKVGSQLEQCKQLGAKNAWRDAYHACTNAINEDPENIEAKELRNHMLAELRREMKGIYEDSVLEESMGNVDTAKDKWKKIVNEDLPDDDYTTKARSKLEKYGMDGL